MGWETNGSDSGGQAWYDICMAVSPTDVNQIIVGGVNTWKSTNGGVTWSIMTNWYQTSTVPAMHADQHDLIFLNGTTIYAANDGGIYRSTNNGVSWTDLTNGMAISQLYRASAAQTDNRVIAGLQDNGTKLRSTTGTWSDEIGGDGMDCAIDPTNASYMYGTLYYGDIQRSTNGGSSWTSITPSTGTDGAWVSPVLLDPVHPATIYLGYTDLMKSTDRGTTWSKITAGQTAGKFISNISVAPSDPLVIYISWGTAMAKTTNGGTSWTNLTNTAPYSTTTTASLTITGATTAISTYRYRCITTNDCGTTNSAGVVLTVNPTPTVASTTPGNRCGTGTVNLAATASAGTLNWFTASTGGASIGTGASFTTPSISATTTYYVSATNSGCTSARTAVVATVNQNVTLTSNPANATICAGSSATLTAAGGSSYTWTGGQTTSSITVSPTTTTTYSVTGVTNCTASASVTITVNPLPNTALSALPTVCNYNPAFALTQGTPAGGTYSGTGVSGSNFNPATAGIGTTTITYSVTQNGCTKSVTGQIIVSGCAGLEDQQNDDLLILYPNPVEGWMTIEGENLSKYQDIELRDEAGRLVGSWKVENVKMSVVKKSATDNDNAPDYKLIFTDTTGAQLNTGFYYHKDNEMADETSVKLNLIEQIHSQLNQLEEMNQRRQFLMKEVLSIIS
jgi:photosystem II stability/assembly factor-like uncharacterized protein